MDWKCKEYITHVERHATILQLDDVCVKQRIFKQSVSNVII